MPSLSSEGRELTYEERRAPAGLAGIVSRAWFIEAPRLQRFEKILPLPFAHVIVNLSTPYRLFSPRRGVISAVSDDRGRKTVLDLFPQVEQRIFPVGRLDFDTSGVLLLTNDGEFANQMTHPRYKIDKTYVAKVKGLPRREDLKKLERGIELEDGKTSPAKVKVLSSDKQQNKSIIALTIHEGKNRQVKRMFEAIGCPVQKLKREQFAFLGLHGLNAGESRELTAHEVKQLRVLSETGKIG